MNIGDKAPEILGINEKGEEIRLSDYKGKKIVLYFYPKDNTSGCTTEACNLRDHYEELQQAGYAVIGASVDGEKSHQKFIEKHALPFPLIADTDKKLVNSLYIPYLKKVNAIKNELKRKYGLDILIKSHPAYNLKKKKISSIIKKIVQHPTQSFHNFVYITLPDIIYSQNKIIKF